MTKFVPVFSVALSTLLLAGCEGSDASGQAFWQAVVSNLVWVLFALATPILVVLVQKLLSIAKDKWSLDISTSQEELVMNAVRQGIAFAEEQSRKALREGQPARSGDEKKNEAVEFIADKLDTLGVVTWGGDQLGNLVEAALYSKREDPADPTEMGLPEPAEDTE